MLPIPSAVTYFIDEQAAQCAIVINAGDDRQGVAGPRPKPPAYADPPGIAGNLCRCGNLAWRAPHVVAACREPEFTSEEAPAFSQSF